LTQKPPLKLRNKLPILPSIYKAKADSSQASLTLAFFFLQLAFPQALNISREAMLST